MSGAAAAPGQGRALEGRRVVVVGASRGIGCAVVDAAAERGARVVAAARTAPAAPVTRGEVHWVCCDVRDEHAVHALARTATDRLGGVDAVIYGTGVADLVPLADLRAAAWHDLLATNLVGAALVAGAFVPSLAASSGRLAVLSSDSVGNPMPGLGAYAVTKAALDELVLAWRAEHPEVAFTRIVVGPTATGFADGWDPDLAASAFQRWAEGGWLDRVPEPASPEAVAGGVVDWVAADVASPDVHLASRPTAGSP